MAASASAPGTTAAGRATSGAGRPQEDDPSDDFNLGDALEDPNMKPTPKAPTPKKPSGGFDLEDALP
ncbi:hypothetical protein, partial [Salmonella enterica]|uniref:hypothetical protein n=1 Tax=Salmonella enterica TaxID=28901 RepID=UPI0032987960